MDKTYDMNSEYFVFEFPLIATLSRRTTVECLGANQQGTGFSLEMLELTTRHCRQNKSSSMYTTGLVLTITSESSTDAQSTLL